MRRERDGGPISRRGFARMVGLGSLGLGILGKAGWSQQEEFGVPKANYDKNEIFAVGRYVDGVFYFDPIGLYVKPGDTVDFYIVGGGTGRPPTVTAYHPNNDNHELRIPENAKPFDSGIDVKTGRREAGFRWTFEVEGTYDYYSRFEERIGMVARIVVGRPGGPGEKPWGYGNKEGRKAIPPAVLKRAKLLDSQEIVKKRVISFPYAQFATPYPLW